MVVKGVLLDTRNTILTHSISGQFERCSNSFDGTVVD
jgi:hypothetical protein